MRELFILIIALIIIFVLLGYMISIMPDAMHTETIKQRAVPTGQWHSQQGYWQYAEFVKNNKNY